LYEDYEKLAGFDGAEMFVDSEYIVHRATAFKKEKEVVVAVNVYSRNNYKFNDQIHTQIIIDDIKPKTRNSEDAKEFNQYFINEIQRGKRYREVEKKVFTFAVGYFYEPETGHSLVVVGTGEREDVLQYYEINESFLV